VTAKEAGTGQPEPIVGGGQRWDDEQGEHEEAQCFSMEQHGRASVVAMGTGRLYGWWPRGPLGEQP
jgi:hypothetical protein